MTAPAFLLSFTPPSGGGPFYARLDTREVRDTIERLGSLSDMDWQLPARSWPGAATDLTHPLYVKDLPRIQLNRLYYPESGCMAWGYVYLMFSGTEIETIKAHPTGTITLKSTGQNGTDTLAFQNFTLVATVPISEVGTNYGGRITGIGNDADTRHLCLFADERFYTANYSPALDIEDVPETWAALLTACLSACGISAGTLPDVPDAYGTPSRYSDWLESFQYSAAVMLDAALTNAGLMLVRSIAGAYSVLTTDQAADIEEAATHDDHFLRAGGEWSRNGRGVTYLGSLPANVTLYFPLWDDSDRQTAPFPPNGPRWLWQWDNDEGLYHVRSPLTTTYYYPVSVSLADAFNHAGVEPPTTANKGTKIFRETARACGDENTEPGSGGNEPKNIDALNELALEVAANYYRSKLYSLQQETWNGFVTPSGSGWFTYIYYMGLDCWTKIRGEPANAEYEQLMHDVPCDQQSSSGSGSEGSGSGGQCECMEVTVNGHAIPDPSGVLTSGDIIHDHPSWSGSDYRLAHDGRWKLTYNDGADGWAADNEVQGDCPEGTYTAFGKASGSITIKSVPCPSGSGSEGSGSGSSPCTKEVVIKITCCPGGKGFHIHYGEGYLQPDGTIMFCPTHEESCGECGCPTSCSGCSDIYGLTLAGPCFGTDPVKFNLNRVGDSCNWTGGLTNGCSTYSASLKCTGDGAWELSVDGSSMGPDCDLTGKWVSDPVANTTGCPPTGPWSMNATVGNACPDNTITASLST